MKFEKGNLEDEKNIEYIQNYTDLILPRLKNSFLLD